MISIGRIELLLVAATATLATAALGADWRSYEVYQPTITRNVVIEGITHPHKYNHCTTIAWFQDRWFCLWGSNIPSEEHAPGQRMLFSSSRDGKEWSPIEMPFSSEKHSENPVLYPVGKGHQWQPNLAVVDGELWALWNHGGSDKDFKTSTGRSADLRGLYFSRLRNADGKWINRQLKWDGEIWPTVDGQSWFIASTQNPYRLRSGRVLAPVTLYAMKGRAADAPPKADSWWCREKRNSVIFTDDGGKTWRLSPGCITPGFSWIQWEPTVWEQPDGTVLMFARNNTHPGLGHGNPTSGEYLLWSISKDCGETWAPQQFVPMESICSRMHVVPVDGRGTWAEAKPQDDFTSRRYVMVHNDAPGALYEWGMSRHNLALFFKRGGGIDFVAGNSLTGTTPEVAYPQMWHHGDTMAISYTRDNRSPRSRSIEVALVSPLPSQDHYYLFPRGNTIAPEPRPERIGSVVTFNKDQHIATKQPIDPGEDGFSFGAWIRPHSNTGVILDTRGGAPASGFVIMLRPQRQGPKSGLSTPAVLYVSLASEPRELSVDLPINLTGDWHYVGVTVDNRAGYALVCVDGTTKTLQFHAPAPRPLKGNTGHIGAKRLATSRLSGFVGKIRSVALYPGANLGAGEHRWLHNQFSNELHRPNLNEAFVPKDQPVLLMDAADEAAFERNFILPSLTHRGVVEMVTVDGLQCLRLHDHSSAGIDLDENHREKGDKVSLKFRFQIERGTSQTLCTVGDFNHPARLVARDGNIFLSAGKEEKLCGKVATNGWTSVSVETFGDRTRASVGDGEPVELPHQPSGTWAYLGEGFPEYEKYPGTQFLIEVQSVKTQISRTNKP